MGRRILLKSETGLRPNPWSRRRKETTQIKKKSQFLGRINIEVHLIIQFMGQLWLSGSTPLKNSLGTPITENTSRTGGARFPRQQCALSPMMPQQLDRFIASCGATGLWAGRPAATEHVRLLLCSCAVFVCELIRTSIKQCAVLANMLNRQSRIADKG